MSEVRVEVVRGNRDSTPYRPGCGLSSPAAWRSDPRSGPDAPPSRWRRHQLLTAGNRLSPDAVLKVLVVVIAVGPLIVILTPID